MKLFRFYPETYSRQYVIAESKEDLLSKTDELFQHYMNTYRSWMLDDSDYEQDIAEMKTFFCDEIQLAIETELTFIDSRY